MTMPLTNNNSEVVPLPSIRTKSSEQTRLSSARRLCRDLPISTDTNYIDVYYRESSVSIPFIWESQPGTPKVKSKELPIPSLTPLTPPPSFHSSHRRLGRKVPKSNLLSNHHVLLSKLSLKKNHEPKQPNISSPATMSFDSGTEEDECESSPFSTLPFPAARSSGGRFRGCSLSIIKLLLGESKLALH